MLVASMGYHTLNCRLDELSELLELRRLALLVDKVHGMVLVATIVLHISRSSAIAPDSDKWDSTNQSVAFVPATGSESTWIGNLEYENQLFQDGTFYDLLQGLIIAHVVSNCFLCTFCWAGRVVVCVNATPITFQRLLGRTRGFCLPSWHCTLGGSGYGLIPDYILAPQRQSYHLIRRCGCLLHARGKLPNMTPSEWITLVL